MKIADENWSQYPRLHAAVVEGFDAALQNPANRFYIARYRGEMLGFVRFDDLKNGNVSCRFAQYPASFAGLRLGRRF